ncbi:hypothetical protein HZB78_00390 [Candidatus Collierbacteria bacterium]|nr:hypothetical protein [Candidatus Collierbacteria bacterium]
MGALIEYKNGKTVYLKKATRYVDSKKNGEVLIVPFPSGFSVEGDEVFKTKLNCFNAKFKFKEGVVVATDESLNRLSFGFHGLNLDASLGDGGSPGVIILPGMLDFSLPGSNG